MTCSSPRRAIAALSIAALCVVLFAAAARADNWPQYGHDNGNSFASDENWVSRGNVATLQESWTAFDGSSATSTPCVVGDTAFVELYVGGLKAISVTDGHTLWSTPLHSTMYGSPTFSNGRVYCADMNARAYCFLAHTGTLVWSASVGDSTTEGCYGSPAIGDGKMYLGVGNKSDDNPCNQGRVVALNIATGAVAWTWYTVSDPHGGGGVWNAVAYENASKRVYVATGNACNNDYSDNADCIVALDSGSGNLVWRYLAVRRDNKDYDFGSAPALFLAGTRPAVAAGCKSGYVYACDRATGDSLWETFVAPQYKYPFVTSTAVAEDRLIVGVGGDGSGPGVPGSIVALKSSTGQILWGRNVAGPVYGTPCVVNGVVFVTNGVDSLLAFDVQNGAPLWGVSLGSPLNYSGPCVAAGHVFVTGYTIGTRAFTLPANPDAVGDPASRGGIAVHATPFADGVRFRVEGVPEGRLEIFTVRGARVAELPVVAGTATWNGATAAGLRLPHGTYWARCGAARTRFFLVRR